MLKQNSKHIDESSTTSASQQTDNVRRKIGTNNKKNYGFPTWHVRSLPNIGTENHGDDMSHLNTVDLRQKLNTNDQSADKETKGKSKPVKV
ncbi:hypothetical protein F2Q70_00003553 [Brassica cretica]|uniref:Uncharacterized protein n=1 Tax=Brassica cretica TaxID=69181 RepID=A0A8S9J4T8_BRACR|nr:hypothetical protein F2Q70_00003553 [Brassica cretica]